MKKIGFIQSRGLGDICIALPIARHYHDQGYQVVWPICEEFIPSFIDTAAWVKWVPVKTDPQGDFFYNTPLRELKNRAVKEIICLYQSLNVLPELSDVPWFQIQKFDEFKYTRAGVPFKKKWTLGMCISRNSQRETALYQQVVKQPLYYVTHTQGSSFKADPDLSSLPPEWQRVEITEGLTNNVFDWLSVLENAQALILIDSIFANLCDQLDIQTDKYWIPRSHIHLTPVLGSNWTILDPVPGSLAAQRIFASSNK